MEQVVTWKGGRGAKNRRRKGLSPLANGGMTIQVQRGLQNKHSNSSSASSHIRDHCSEVTMTTWSWSKLIYSKAVFLI